MTPETALAQPIEVSPSVTFVPEVSDVEITGSAIPTLSSAHETTSPPQDKTSALSQADLHRARNGSEMSSTAAASRASLDSRIPTLKPPRRNPFEGIGRVLKWGVIVLIPAGLVGA